MSGGGVDDSRRDLFNEGMKCMEMKNGQNVIGKLGNSHAEGDTEFLK